MGIILRRSSFSSNIKERCDFSCAIFDRRGELAAQAAHIPVHLGSMPLSVKAAIESCTMEEGDMVMLNDPFQGGTHLPDITLVAPVYTGETAPSFYVANRAHHSDVGGMTAGSMPLSTSLYQEGVIIPPLKIVEHGEIDRKLMDFFLSNVRTPLEREGDFSAQIMANLTGAQRSRELIEKYGAVSEQVAEALARLARKRANSDFAIGITGIAGPTGGDEQKPIGLVYISVDWNKGCEIKRFVFSGDRESIRLRAAQTALNMLRLKL